MDNPNREPAIKTTLMFKEMQIEVNKININMAELQKDVSYIKEKVNNNVGEVKELSNKIDQFIKKAGDCYVEKEEHSQVMSKLNTLDEKYAPRLAWDILRYVGSVMAAIIITALMYLIIKQ
jgi:uncharacterized coiled-coil DUF342 family protein